MFAGLPWRVMWIESGGGARSVAACLLVASLLTAGAAVCAWRRKRPVSQTESRQVGSYSTGPLVDDTSGATAPLASPATNANAQATVPLSGSSSPSNQLPAALQAERVNATPASGDVTKSKSRSPANSAGIGRQSRPRPAMIDSASRSRAGSTGMTSHQQTVLLESTMDTRIPSSRSAREGTAMLHGGSEVGSHALSMVGSSVHDEDPPGELALWPQGSKHLKELTSPHGAALGRGGIGAMSRESSAAFSAVIGPAKPPLPTPSESQGGLLSRTSNHHQSSGLTASAALAARANVDMHGSFSRSASQQPTGSMALGGVSYASSALSGVLTLPPAHDDRTLHGGAQVSDPHATMSNSQPSGAAADSTLQLVHTSDGGLLSHGNGTLETQEFNLQSMSSHVVLTGAAGGGRDASGSGSGANASAVHRVPKSFSAPMDPDNPAKISLRASLPQGTVPAAQHLRPVVETRPIGSEPADAEARNAGGVAFSPPAPTQQLNESKVGSVAITSGFTRSLHTGGATPNAHHGPQSASPAAATPQLAKQASGTV